MILLDTHIWIWFNLEPDRVPLVVKQQAAECAISSVSVWELLLLLEKGKIVGTGSTSEVLDAWLDRYPFQVLPLDFKIAILSRTLPFEHEDPADRFIAATAFHHGIELATADQRLLALPWLKTCA